MISKRVGISWSCILEKMQFTFILRNIQLVISNCYDTRKVSLKSLIITDRFCQEKGKGVMPLIWMQVLELAMYLSVISFPNF